MCAGVGNVCGIDNNCHQARATVAEKFGLRRQEHTDSQQIVVIATNAFNENGIVGPATTLLFTTDALANTWLLHGQAATAILGNDRVVCVRET